MSLIALPTLLGGGTTLKVLWSVRMERRQPSSSVINVQANDSARKDLQSDTHKSGESSWGVATQILHHQSALSDPYNATSAPLYQTATFKQSSALGLGEYDYTRSGNPTRVSLEGVLAKLDGAAQAFCFTSGMAALATVLHLVSSGEEIVAGDDIYGGSDRLLTKVAPKAGVKVTLLVTVLKDDVINAESLFVTLSNFKRVNMCNLSDVESAVTSKTKLIWLETPTNPRMWIADVRGIIDIAHRNGALVMVDNSIMSPILMKPIELGADIVMLSATKFVSGHSDVMAGVLSVKSESLAKDLYFLQNAEGAGLAPFDCWLCLRGLKTMALRIEKQQANAQRIAEFLAKHPDIEKVYYPGLPDHDGHDLHFSQAKGPGVVLSFITGSFAMSKHIVESTKLFDIAVSFGSVNSTCSLPCFMSHASIPAHVREERGLVDKLVRISVGIEDVEDLIADLDEAIRTAPARELEQAKVVQHI